MTIALNPPDGSKPRWEFPSYDARLPPYTQRSFDYMGQISPGTHRKHHWANSILQRQSTHWTSS